MTAPAAGILPCPADVLACAADLLESTYPAARLTSVTLLKTIRQAAAELLLDDASGAYWLAWRAVHVLAEHLREAGEDPKALDRWTTVFARVEMVAQMRAAASPVEVVA